MDLATDVKYLAEALGRRIDVVDHRRVVQRCPLCLIELGFEGRPMSRAALYRELFAAYDEHRCDKLFSDDAYERADAECARMAARAVVIREREQHEAPHDTPSLYERAERESVRMAELAQVYKPRATASA